MRRIGRFEACAAHHAQAAVLKAEIQAVAGNGRSEDLVVGFKLMTHMVVEHGNDRMVALKNQHLPLAVYVPYLAERRSGKAFATQGTVFGIILSVTERKIAEVLRTANIYATRRLVDKYGADCRAVRHHISVPVYSVEYKKSVFIAEVHTAVAVLSHGPVLRTPSIAIGREITNRRERSSRTKRRKQDYYQKYCEFHMIHYLNIHT